MHKKKIYKHILLLKANSKQINNNSKYVCVMKSYEKGREKMLKCYKILNMNIDLNLSYVEDLFEVFI